MNADSVARWRALIDSATARMPARVVWRGVIAAHRDLPAPREVPLADRERFTALAQQCPLSERDIDALLEGRGGADDRRGRGAFYTPASLARALSERVLHDATSTPSIRDPACGGGALLLAAYDTLLARGARPEVVLQALSGWDIDPGAVEVARLRVHERAGQLERALLAPVDDPAWRCVDTLSVRPEDAPVDVVLANPPFGNAIRSTTSRSDADRERFAALYPEAATGAYDRAGLFVEWSARSASRAVGIVVPRALLAAPYASRLRRWVDSHLPLAEVLDVDTPDAFSDAAVFVAGLVLANGPADEECPGQWALRTSPWASVAAAATRIGGGSRLDDLVEVRASCAVGEAYEWRDEITEDEQAVGLKLVTSGAIDPFSIAWGDRTQRYLKRRWEHPVVARHAMSARRQAQADAHKLLVPGLSAVLEAALDEGEHVGAVATLSLTPLVAAAPALLPMLELFLNSLPARGWFLAHYGAAGLSGGSVQVTRNKLAALPTPAWMGGAEADETAGRRCLEAAEGLPILPRVHRPPLEWAPAAKERARGIAFDGRAAFAWLATACRESDERRVCAASLALLSLDR